LKKTIAINREMVRGIIQRRARDAHKGDYGKILIFAGSSGMAGAAALAARGALRSGAGLVRLAATDQLTPILQVLVPEATCRPRVFTAAVLAEYQAVIAGPGLGCADENIAALTSLIKYTKGCLVLDADALNLIAAQPQLMGELTKRSAGTVLTPHVGEAARLLGQRPSTINANRMAALRRLVAKTGAVTVLKGAGTLIGLPTGQVFVNSTGNPGMATGGSGDVLAGVIGSLAGQDQTPGQAAVAGAYLHGLAGDLASETFGEYGLMAGDIADWIAIAIRETLSDDYGEVEYHEIRGDLNPEPETERNRVLQ
jgi:NAD(P)H-hydrate epimerase